MSKKFIFKTNNKLDKSKLNNLNTKIINVYKIGLQRIGRKKNCVFQIVVMNWNRKKIDILGYFSPNLTSYKDNNNLKKNLLNLGKTISLDTRKIFFWLSKKVILGPFLHKIIKIFYLGFILVEFNYFLSDNFILLKYDFNKINRFNFFYDQMFNIHNKK
jgi:ribosomal protein S16